MKVKSEKGSISIYVLSACMLVLAVLMSVFMRNQTKLNTQRQQQKIIEQQYSDDSKIDEIYNRAIAADKKDYIKNGLILHYDAIDNTGDGHDNNATTWKDLSNSSNDGIVTGASFNSNYLNFDGVDDFVRTTTEVDYKSSKEVTVEILDINGSLLENSNTAILMESSSNFNSNSTGYVITTNEGGIEHNLRFAFRPTSGYNLKQTDENEITNEKINLYSFILNTSATYNDFIKIYKNGELIEINSVGAHTADISDIELINYIVYIGSRNGASAFTKMKLGNFKVYNRELTQNEIQHNYEVNQQRFEYNY